MNPHWGRIAAVAVVWATAACSQGPVDVEEWSAEEIEVLRSLWIGSLEPLPPDPTNRWADDDRAAALGHRLFFDARLSANGRVSCATCHRPEADFQDGVPLGEGIGTADRRTMPIAGTAFSPWQFWDGRSDSQWAQALGPLENPVEHGATRAQVVHALKAHYPAEYEALFGPLPDLSGVPIHAGPVEDPAASAAWGALADGQRAAVTDAFVNLGKAIAAYERRIQPGPSRFDHYVAYLVRHGRPPRGIMTGEEVAGLRLFIGKASCTQCHNGPLFTDHHFHNTGIPAASGLPSDAGRAGGAPAVLAHEFNCRSRHNDAANRRCQELDFMLEEGPELERAFKTPSLRNVAERPPYMHAGQFTTLAHALEHYDRAPGAPSGETSLEPLGLSPRELASLEAYLRALTGSLVAPPGFLGPPPGFPGSPQ